MAPISPGLASRPVRKAKKPTPTTKLHRFEPFSKRISKLKIDPIHRVENGYISRQDEDLSHSHFRSSLDNWAELNLSQNYTDFAKKVQPLSESLPQLLHHSDTVVNLLLEYIGKRDALSLESLLSLVAHIAHDLGQAFEKYFEKTVTLVVDVAASHDAADVVEWCFTCLAWIFKFLSRLLVPDLRPLLGIMIPYLGSRKAYVTTFTAESLAFLLRKAATSYSRSKQFLNNAICFLLRSETSSFSESYQAGLMTLFSEVAIGTDFQLHASATNLISCLVGVLLSDAGLSAPQLSLIEGVTTSIIHRTDPDGFAPLCQWLHDFVSSLTAEDASDQVVVAQKMLFVLVSTRKGSRVQSWTDLFRDLLRVSESTTNRATTIDVSLDPTSAVALAIQYAPLNDVLPQMAALLKQFDRSLPPVQFFQFCEHVATIAHERFQDLVLPFLQQYIISKWRQHEASACLMVVHLQDIGESQDEVTKLGSTVLPEAWFTRAVELLSNLRHSDLYPFDVLADGFLLTTFRSKHRRDARDDQRLLDVLRQNLILELRSEGSPPLSAQRRFVLGRIFSVYAELGIIDERDGGEIWPLVADLPADHFQFELFLAAIARFADRVRPIDHLDGRNLVSLRNRILDNLLGNSRGIKRHSLRLLAALSESSDQALLGLVDAARQILDVQYSPNNARQITMLLREVPQHHQKMRDGFKKLVPYFCLGLLANYFEQTRQKLCTIIAQLAKDPAVEIIVYETAMEWLQAPQIEPATANTNTDDTTKKRLTMFECSNTLSVRKTFQQISLQYTNAQHALEARFEREHQLAFLAAPSSSRELGLLVLKYIPDIAEKRSRLLIPIFLSASLNQRSDESLADPNESTSSRTLSPTFNDSDWQFRDRRAFLELLGLFKNPRVLYKSTEVRTTLSDLLKNGNSDIQRLALKAILKWKDTEFQQYHDALLGLLEDKTYSSQMNSFLGSEEGSLTVDPTLRGPIMDVVLRLLYGQMIGRPGTFGSQELKRKATLRAVLRLPKNEVMQFIQISLGGLAGIQLLDTSRDQVAVLKHDLIPLDHQHGLLRMIHSVMELSQDNFRLFAKAVIGPVIYCAVRACRHLGREVDDESGEIKPSGTALARNVRKVGLQCLDMLFKYSDVGEWSGYLSIIYLEVIVPRLSNFAVETAQGISWLLRIFATWCQSHETIAFLTGYSNSLLPAIWECLGNSLVKDDVKVFVVDHIILEIARLTNAERAPSKAAADVLEEQMEALLPNIVSLLESKPSRDVSLSILKALPELAPFARSSATAGAVLSILARTLDEAGHKASPKMRGSLLQALASLLLGRDIALNPELRSQIWIRVSNLLNYFKDLPNRLACCDILDAIEDQEKDLKGIGAVCRGLDSSHSVTLLTQAFDGQIEAIRNIQDKFRTFSLPLQLLPILNSLLYMSRSSEDSAVRSNAVSCLKQILVHITGLPSAGFDEIIESTVLPSLVAGFKEQSEFVRADFVALFGVVVQHSSGRFRLDDLQVLLVQNDEEASFFSNILHIQQHRRLRALRRLESEAQDGKLRAKSIGTYLLPLIEKFITAAEEDSSAQNLKGQSIVTWGVLMRWVEWPLFRTMFRNSKKDLKSSNSSEKNAIKLLGVAADALCAAIEEPTRTGSEEGYIRCHLSLSLPASSTISKELTNHFLPDLTKFIHLKDETQISLRLPAAVTAIKLLRLLPQDEADNLMSPVLLDVSQIFRSRTQEARDVARHTLAQMVGLIGPRCISLVLKELKNSLVRGYQLHVLSYTVHSILVENTTQWATGDLDSSLDELVAVAMEDIFGNVGQEKENEDYISNMKEVKSSKSFDTMELLAKSTSVPSLFKLIQPLQSLLEGSLTSKQARHVDEILRRVGVGLSRSAAANSRDMLTFSYQTIQEFYNQRNGASHSGGARKRPSEERYLVQLMAAHKDPGGSSTSPQLYKIARFALDLTRSTLQKHAALLTAQNVQGFLPITGDALIEGQEDVKISGMRLLSAILKLPMPELDENAQVYILEAVKVIKGAVSTNTESSQAALKLISALLRDRKNVSVRDSDLAYVLHRILPDLEEPDRQGVTFNFVKAVMARKIIMPEVYEIVDKIGVMMVTNHTRSARDAARGIYVHFLLEYPQSKSRWSKQLKFLLKNLEYKHREGRQSLMEAVNLLLTKVDAEFAAEIITTFFIPTILRMANDEISECREMAGALLGQIFRKADSAQMKTFLETLQSWTEQTNNSALRKIGFQAYSILFASSKAGADSELPYLRKSVQAALRTGGDRENDSGDMLLNALKLLLKLVVAHPAIFLSSKQSSMWSDIRSIQSHPSSDVQSMAARLLAIWFHDLARTNAEKGFAKVPLVGTYGLELPAQAIIDVLRDNLRILKRIESQDELTGTVIQNTLFIGRCLSVNKLSIKVPDHSNAQHGAESDDDDQNGSDLDPDNDKQTRSISAIQYLLHQASSILRREPLKYTTGSLIPKKSILTLLKSLLTHMATTDLTPTLAQLLTPLTHLTDPSTTAPRSADPQFATAYSSLIESAHEVLEAVQKKVGDTAYVRAITDVSRAVRERRQERRAKRAIERVAEPEKAAMRKRRKMDKKKERKVEITGAFRKRRLG